MPQIPEPSVPPTPPDLTAIGKLIHDEIDRNNKYLEFAQGQISKDREFYKHLYTYATAFVAFIILVAGALGYSSLNQMRTDMKAAVDAQMLRSQMQIEGSVQQELANVRTEVQKRIDAEFKSDNIAALGRSVAKERIETEATGIIRVEVASALKEKTARLETAYQNSAKLLDEYRSEERR